MKKKYLLALMMLILCFNAGTVMAAGPIEITADTIEYRENIVIAQGNVTIVSEQLKAVAPHAKYDTKSAEMLLSGGVHATRGELTLTAANIQTLGKEQIVATGQVVATEAKQRLSGDRVDYWSDKQYAIVTGNAALNNEDTVLKAPKIEAWTQEQRAIATGGVEIVSDTRKLTATANRVDYTAESGGRAILTGNVHVVQDGNTMTGEKIVMDLNNKAVTTNTRTKLVIKPQ